MGVRSLARSTTATLASVEARLVGLGATPLPSAPRWRRQCLVMLPRFPDTGLHELFVLSGSDSSQDSHYLVSRAPHSSVLRVVSAGPEITAILDAADTHNQRLKVGLEGRMHECGDFLIRLGNLFLNGALSGVVLEVEYLPCALACTAATCAPLHALVDMLLPPAERDFCSSATECLPVCSLTSNIQGCVLKKLPLRIYYQQKLQELKKTTPSRNWSTNG